MEDDADKAAHGAPSKPIHQPTPRRPGTFSLTPLSTPSTDPSSSHTPSPNDGFAGTSPASGTLAPDAQVQPSPSSTMPDGTSDETNSTSTTSGLTQKTRSIVNLTSSTLFGIYSPSVDDNNREEPSTPFGTGAQTPYRSSAADLSIGRLPPTASAASLERAREKRFSEQSQIRHVRSASGSQHHQPRSQIRAAGGLAWRISALFCVGLAYGEFVTRLHDTREVAPVQVEAIDRQSWTYVLFWGIVAVAVGNLLPWVDGRWGSIGSPEPETTAAFKGEKGDESPEERAPEGDQVNNSLGADWNPIVRTIGAFVGIAFAIRRLPWQSTLQVSLTLALVNPVIWYLIDRSRTGFALSTIIGTAGAAALISTKPDVIPTPATARSSNTFIAGVSYESVGVATWICSVLFCSCICFGNLGRRLSRWEQPVERWRVA